MFNTAFISLVSALLQVIACTLAGYGFARFDFPLKRLWFVCVILVIVIVIFIILGASIGYVLGGITGQIYRQFAVAISSAIVFSGVVALTLSPALCALMLRIPKERRHGPLRWFNTLVRKSRSLYMALSEWLARRAAVTLVCLAVVVAIAVLLLNFTPRAFLPDEDQGIIFADLQLPEGATLSRTKALVKELMPTVTETPGVRQFFGVAGFSMIGGRGENPFDLGSGPVLAGLFAKLDHAATVGCRGTPENSKMWQQLEIDC